MRLRRNRIATAVLVASVGLAGVACSDYDSGGSSPGQEEGVTDGGGDTGGDSGDESGVGY